MGKGYEPHQTVQYRLKPLFPTHNCFFEKSKIYNLLNIQNYKAQIHQWSIVSVDRFLQISFYA